MRARDAKAKIETQGVVRCEKQRRWNVKEKSRSKKAGRGDHGTASLGMLKPVVCTLEIGTQRCNRRARSARADKSPARCQPCSELCGSREHVRCDKPRTNAHCLSPSRACAAHRLPQSAVHYFLFWLLAIAVPPSSLAPAQTRTHTKSASRLFRTANPRPCHAVPTIRCGEPNQNAFERAGKGASMRARENTPSLGHLRAPVLA